MSTSSPRVRVTSSRTSATTAAAAPVTKDIDEQTALGDVYVAGLMRAQLRLSLVLVAIAVVGIGGFPLVLAFVPGTRALSLGPVPFPWLVLGVLIYPVMWLLARWYDRASTRLESEFTTAVTARSGSDEEHHGAAYPGNHAPGGGSL